MLKMKSFTVTEITRYIKRILSSDPIINQVIVEGEISNFTRHSSGHAYFTLKDDQSKLACVMFSQYLETLNFIPKNGDRVHAKGQITIYERDGRYQLGVVSIENIGLGALHIQFEALKAKLEKRGLFDAQHKKALPTLPQKIGIITSPTGAAIQDIIAVANRRLNFSELLIYPVRVQGEFSKDEICRGISYFNGRDDIDLIILARGGGSIEELWSFNEEVVAEAIFASKIPIISGIGHETDTTICDFVADRRAATPSAAAEIAIKSKTELTMELNKSIQRLSIQIRRRVELEKSKMQRYEPNQLASKISNTLQRNARALAHQEELFIQKVDKRIKMSRERLNVAGAKLDSLSPFGVMRRGYGIVTKDDVLVTRIDQVTISDTIQIRLADGRLDASVQSVVPIKSDF